MTCLIELKKYWRIWFVVMAITVCCCLLLLQAKESLSFLGKTSFLTGSKIADVLIVFVVCGIVAGVLQHRKYKRFSAAENARKKVTTHYTYYVYDLAGTAMLLLATLLGLIVYSQNLLLAFIPASSLVRSLPTESRISREFKNCELLFV